MITLRATAPRGQHDTPGSPGAVWLFSRQGMLLRVLARRFALLTMVSGPTGWQLPDRVHDLQAQSNSSPGAYEQHSGSPSRLLAPPFPVLVLGPAHTPASRVRLLAGSVLGSQGKCLPLLRLALWVPPMAQETSRTGQVMPTCAPWLQTPLCRAMGAFEIQLMFSAHPAGRHAARGRCTSRRWPEQRGRFAECERTLVQTSPPSLAIDAQRIVLRGSFPQRVHVRHRVPVTCGGNQARYDVQGQILRRRSRCT
ncbi:unnamed protein product [Peronospora belbahrii]|uniref:Uncharacterized protein n=1 Tax=Peronospora belbahrii TaxID=622444 RepID=A0ABN8CZC4_9STRA|nr:unnamed protein product [Peronospora belbahrii]